jgi:tetratricopeptide (TPR) repeat protein
LAALACVRAIDAKPAWRRPAIAAGVVLLALGSWLVVDRGRTWSDPVRLWDEARFHAPRSYRAQTNAGLALAAAGRWDAADRAFAAALALTPDYPPALVGQGVAAHKRGDRDAARARYERAAAVAPGYVPAWYNLGLVLQESGNAVEAERAYRRALEINPLHAPSLLNLGVLLLLQSRWADADAVLKAADAATPDSPDVVYHRGLLAELTGSPQAARAFYLTAERLALAADRAPIAASARARLTALP